MLLHCKIPLPIIRSAYVFFKLLFSLVHQQSYHSFNMSIPLKPLYMSCYDFIKVFMFHMNFRFACTRMVSPESVLDWR